ncbi:beta-N-acetylhexosaminidase [Dawidia soli]|uniref:beta-N-acetylhexosaminidase n=1 Tax=Dawidia soli TaxID=2782352 RepID=A0AAP2GET2_9BACT|nr:beta-N-acetylhexosaminidase [Dawidia soli]MBT1688639.1 family 20 glycosylhydrolase [Dawidia soli]
MSSFQTFRFTPLVVVLLAACVTACTKAPKDASPEALSRFQNIIPRPSVEAKPDGKAFLITRATAITIANDSLRPVAQYLADVLNKGTGYTLSVSTSNEAPASGIFITTRLSHPDQGREGYSITTAGDLMTITGKPAGVFYAAQTLRQLLPPAIEKAPAPGSDTTSWEIASGQIVDLPQFAWRGSMLDVARHFFGMDDVKRYIDLISFYKMNILHLHLSDDQGWRIEIKSWPRLTEHGGSTQVGGGKGGFFTQEQYQELIAYAAERFITVVPEIDMPGHINSALASYGELNGGIQVPKEGRVELDLSTPGTLNGKTQPTQLYTGVKVGFSTLRYDKPETFKFVNDVVRELAAITPGPYFHVGGDEAHVTQKDEYIKFVNRFTEIVKANGKKMIGWEEIAQADIDSNVVVQYWNSEKYALQALEKKAQIIMSPAKKAYLDMQYDSTSRIGLHWAAYIEVDSAYRWDPAAFVDDGTVLGVEAPLWTETVATMNDIEYLVFPRLPGYAELGWTSGTKSWDEYKVRLGKHAARFDALEIDYYQSPKVPWVK